jgi:hypothetical protein
LQRRKKRAASIRPAESREVVVRAPFKHRHPFTFLFVAAIGDRALADLRLSLAGDRSRP